MTTAAGTRGKDRWNVNHWMLAAFCCYLLFYLFFGERVPYNGGRGFDGYFYAGLAQDVPGVLARRIAEYQLDRILPSVVVWSAAKLLGVSIATTPRVVFAFCLYDTVVLSIATLAWLRLSRRLALDGPIAAIGWGCLFLNWIVLKQYQYFAVQTDTTAFALGVCAALCAIERRPYALTTIALIASFAWKTVMPLTLLLVLFPNPAPAETKKMSPKVPMAAALAAAGGTAAITIYFTYIEQFRFHEGEQQINTVSLPLSIVIQAAYAFYVARSVPFGAMTLRLGAPAPIACFVAAWLLRVVILWLLAKFFVNDVAMMDLSEFVRYIFASAVAKPADFILAMIVAYGPGFILVLCYLPRLMRATVAHSLGALLFLIVTMVLVMDTESRQIVFSYPLMIVFLCRALKDVAINRRLAVAFLACSLLLSKAYLPLNALGMGTVSSTETLTTDLSALSRFPWQWLFMNVANYMGWIGYAINFTLILLSTLVLWAYRPTAPVCSSTARP
jgi:hypothetical protein